MIVIIISNIVGIIIGIGIFFLLRSTAYREKHAAALAELKQIQAETKSLEERAHNAYIQTSECNAKAHFLDDAIQAKTQQLNQITAGVEKAEETIRTKMVKEREKWYEQYCDEQVAEMQQAALDFVNQFVSENTKKLNEQTELQEQIDQLRSSIASAVELAKHKMEEENKMEFYRLQLPKTSINDIQALRSVENLLSNPETINKVIWKSYYEHPYTDLIGRLGLANSATCGIYKITNIENEMTYIGQAVNIADRWKQHIKRGIGAETPINNKLYPAMKEFGPENFTFEVVEVCPRAKLNEREDYWQDFYKAKEFGYSVK